MERISTTSSSQRRDHSSSFTPTLGNHVFMELCVDRHWQAGICLDFLVAATGDCTATAEPNFYTSFIYNHIYIQLVQLAVLLLA